MVLTLQELHYKWMLIKPISLFLNRNGDFLCLLPKGTDQRAIKSIQGIAFRFPPQSVSPLPLNHITDTPFGQFRNRFLRFRI